MHHDAPAPLVPLAHAIPDACRRIGIGRTKLYQLLEAGEIRAIKIGKKTLIPDSELQRLVSDLIARTGPAQQGVAVRTEILQNRS